MFTHRRYKVLLILAVLLSPVLRGAGLSDLTYTISNNEVAITDCYEFATGAMDIPATIEGWPVTSIGVSAFQFCSSLTSVTIPNSVTNIGNYAFSECSSLTNIMIPNSVTSLGAHAFEVCTSLTNVTIGSGVTSIDREVFSSCSSLTSVFIPDSVTSIGYSSFGGCHSLPNVTIPDSVTSIGFSTFHSCYSLTSVTIPDSVTSLGGTVFYFCSNLTSIRFEEMTAPSIGANIFLNVHASAAITYPYGATGYTNPFGGLPASIYYRLGTLEADTWLLTYPTATADFQSDDDNDGRSLLLEYALNSDPVGASQDSSLPVGVVDNAGTDHVTLTYRKAQAGVTYTVEQSDDLSVWNTTGVVELVPGDVNNDTVAGVPLGSGKFLRLVVDL